MYAPVTTGENVISLERRATSANARVSGLPSPTSPAARVLHHNAAIAESDEPQTEDTIMKHVLYIAMLAALCLTVWGCHAGAGIG